MRHIQIVSCLAVLGSLHACGSGSGATPGVPDAGVADPGAPVAYADLVRLCAVEQACVGSLDRFGTRRPVGECADILARGLPDTVLDVVVRQETRSGGMATTVAVTGPNAPFIREALARARAATTCAAYLGVAVEHWNRCNATRQRACDGDTLLACGIAGIDGRPTGLPYRVDCSASGGCRADADLGAACRGAPDCAVPAGTYVRCEGDSIRVGCDTPIACRPGTRCAVSGSEMRVDTTRIFQFHASCVPAAAPAAVRCADGTLVMSPAPRCPRDSALPCSAETACDGDRLSVCVNTQRFDLDCASLTGGGTCIGGRCAPR